MFGPVYPASKAALNAITLAMMVELESTGIKGQLSFPQASPKTNLNGYAGTQSVEEGSPRGRARCGARTGRPDGYIHSLGKRNDPVVTESRVLPRIAGKRSTAAEQMSCRPPTRVFRWTTIFRSQI